MSVISEQMALRFDLDAEVQRSQTVGNKSHEPNVQLVCIIFLFLQFGIFTVPQPL